MEKELKAIQESLLDFQKKHNEEIQNIGKSHDETKQAITNFEKEYKERLDEIDLKEAEKQKQIDSMDEMLQELKSRAAQPKQSTSFKSSLESILKENAENIDNKRNKGGRLEIAKTIEGSTPNLFHKADMTEGNNYTNLVVAPDFQPNINFDPIANTLRIRQLLPQSTTNSNSVRIIRETAYTDNTDRIAEGSAYPQSESDLERFSYTVEKIGSRVDFTVEMLEDTPGLASYLSQRLSDSYGKKEDQQLLYGTGTNQLEGIEQDSDTLAYSDDGMAKVAVNPYDVLLNAIRQLEVTNKYSATGILISPGTYFDLVTARDADGAYQFPSTVQNNGGLRVGGVQIFKSTAVTTNDFFVGDWRQYGTIFDKRSLTVSFSDQNGVNFEEDLITAKAGARLTFAKQNPSAMLVGDMTVALAEGSAT